MRYAKILRSAGKDKGLSYIILQKINDFSNFYFLFFSNCENEFDVDSG